MFVLALVVMGVLILGSVRARGSTASPSVLVTVTGHALKGVNVTFGHGADTYHGKFPLHQTLPYSDNYFSYWVAGKLKHGGKITCKVVIGSVTKVGHARGGQHRCYAMLKNRGGGVWK